MKPKSSYSKSSKAPAEQVVKDIRRQTRRHFSAEDKIRIVLEGLRGDDRIAEYCRKNGIAWNLYCRWTKEFRKPARSGSQVTPHQATGDGGGREGSAQMPTGPTVFANAAAPSATSLVSPE